VSGSRCRRERAFPDTVASGRPARIRRLLDWLIYQAFRPAGFVSGNHDEQMAAMRLYSTSKRGVHATPKKRPRVEHATAAMAHQEKADERHAV
jgi:hypothetical protein